MSYPIERRIVSAIPKIKLSSKSYIIAHESGNARNTGNNSLEAEVSFMVKNWRNAFTHFWVGDRSIVQIAEDGFMCYGAGGVLNPHSPAQVELARVDTQAEFDESYRRYVWLLRYLADKHGIPKTLDNNSRSGIKTHEWVSKNLGGTNHTDPYSYLAKWGISRAEFKRDVEQGILVHVAQSQRDYLMEKDTGPKVEQLQKDFNIIGMPVSIDGIFGPQLAATVRLFQSRKKLETDGIVGDKTRAELDKVLKRLAPEPIPGDADLYRVRKSWTDTDSQLGAFENLDTAKKWADDNDGYAVFDGKGKEVYPDRASVVKPASPPPLDFPEGPERLYLNERQRHELAGVFEAARLAGVFESEDHEIKMREGTMSRSTYEYLIGVIAGAALNGGKRI